MATLFRLPKVLTLKKVEIFDKNDASAYTTSIQSEQSSEGASLEWFSVECRKTKTKVITLANHKEHTQYSEPIKTRSN